MSGRLVTNALPVVPFRRHGPGSRLPSASRRAVQRDYIKGKLGRRGGVFAKWNSYNVATRFERLPENVPGRPTRAA
jgi:hypothetical protein